MTAKLMEITFRGTKQVEEMLEKRARLVFENAESAVASTVLFGVARVAMDTPVDTGRARANISGQFGERAGVEIAGPKVDSAAVAAGARDSPTGFNGLEGKVAGNVHYLPQLENGHVIVVTGGGGRRYKLKERTASGGWKVRRVAGRGMFRKNVPIIRQFFHSEMERGVAMAAQGRSIRVRRKFGG